MAVSAASPISLVGCRSVVNGTGSRLAYSTSSMPTSRTRSSRPLIRTRIVSPSTTLATVAVPGASGAEVPALLNQPPYNLPAPAPASEKAGN